MTSMVMDWRATWRQKVTVAEDEEDDNMKSVDLEDPPIFRLEESGLPPAPTLSSRATSRSPVCAYSLSSSTN